MGTQNEGCSHNPKSPHSHYLCAPAASADGSGFESMSKQMSDPRECPTKTMLPPLSSKVGLSALQVVVMLLMCRVTIA